MKDVELICEECPLRECDENSLWCVLRLLTNPNLEQMKYVTANGLRLRKKKFNKRQYQAAYRIEHREEKRSYDRAYYISNKGRKTAAAKANYHSKKGEDEKL